MIGRIKRKIVEQISASNKESFLKWQSQHLPKTTGDINYDLVSFSGAKAFADQLLSIYTFYRNVGKPVSWKIYSDDTYSQEQILALESIEGVKVLPFRFDAEVLPSTALSKYPTLKKVEILNQLNYSRTTVFTDSDILFYPSFKKYIDLINQKNWYLVDEGNGYFDNELFTEYPVINHPFNFGLLVINEQPDLRILNEYIASRINANQLNYWSDQTGFQLMIIKNKSFEPLPKEEFKVGGNDSFRLSHCVDYNKIALRHFVGPVRHKMWQYSWKKVLSV